MSKVTAPESPSQQPLGISHRKLPTMATEADCLSTLELTLVEEHMKTEQMENQQQQLLELLDPSWATAEPALPGQAPSVQAMDEDTHLEMNTGRNFQMRPSNPSDFDSNRTKGQAFPNCCNLYFSIARNTFQNEQALISWALTFFKSGQAASFADQILRIQTSTHMPYLTNWNAFELLPSLCWKDPRGYIDDSNLVVKFKKGLNRSLRTMVATKDPAPAFDNLEARIEAAQRVVDVRETSKVLKKTSKQLRNRLCLDPNPSL
ncbi:hypothetical protein M422DRAFT_272207 [Sphaerobolus stellatus SS14]|uniref:Retrotransposon gag domain-containing protein n=1 Tax=Sphaerobolus stellatus (strain SS14) TaxID=990650 RepID=A0A0C9TC10_SPHS4|nr:hypothetical protein M422DRAFT_272207 [Sphaerobolus stellatus SS14]